MIPQSYKNKHKGESAVLLATGPTLDRFDLNLIPCEKFKTIGVNSILYKNFDLDYYFCAQNPTKEQNHKHKDLEKKDPLLQRILDIKDKTKIFCADGYSDSNEIQKHPEFFTSDEIKKMNCETYSLTHHHLFLKKDISEAPLYNYSIVFPATQFAMYCGFSKLYLVGCDCSGGGSYINKSSFNPDLQIIKNRWQVIEEYKNYFYPDFDIISINPVGLKNLFPYIEN